MLPPLSCPLFLFLIALFVSDLFHTLYKAHLRCCKLRILQLLYSCELYNSPNTTLMNLIVPSDRLGDEIVHMLQRREWLEIRGKTEGVRRYWGETDVNPTTYYHVDGR